MKDVGYRFDIIVIGAGPAGSSAAYTLARKGFKVLVVERGRVPGSKEVFGGRVYADPLREIFPDFDESAPIHRWVTKERISLVDGERMTSIEFFRRGKVSFTTYLTELSAWMTKKVEEAGGTVLTEITVDNLVVEDGKVTGVQVGDEKVSADVVIDGEGINRLLLERAGLVPKLTPRYTGLGVKEVIKLSKEEINDFFGLEEGEGLAWLFMGDVTGGLPGGAFLYTNKDSVSIGLVVMLEGAVKEAREHVSKYVENLRLHPLLEKYFRNGRIMEYSAHLVPEYVWPTLPHKLYADGLLVVGDAAGLLLNLGYNFRGVDFAAYSGYLAAKAVEEAHSKGGMTAENLAIYEKLLEESFILKQLRKFKNAPKMRENRRLYSLYPALVNEVASQLFHAKFETPKLMEAFGKAKEGKIGWFTLVKDLVEVIRSI